MIETQVLDFSVKQGDTFKRTLAFFRPAEVALDLTLYTLTAQLKEFAGDTGTAKATIEILDGVSTNQKIFRLAATITDVLIPRNYWWDLQWVTPGGDVETVFEGTFSVTPQATVPV